jgi:hypothetical protein
VPPVRPPVCWAHTRTLSPPPLRGSLPHLTFDQQITQHHSVVNRHSFHAHLDKGCSLCSRHNGIIVVVGGNDVVRGPGYEGNAREPQEALPDEAWLHVDALQLSQLLGLQNGGRFFEPALAFLLPRAPSFFSRLESREARPTEAWLQQEAFMFLLRRQKRERFSEKTKKYSLLFSPFSCFYLITLSPREQEAHPNQPWLHINALEGFSAPRAADGRRFHHLQLVV